MNFVDRFLNQITMYKLVLYVLLSWSGVAFFYSLFNILAFDPFWYVVSLSIILASSYFSNLLFAFLYKAPNNIESSLITGAILALIISPAKNINDVGFLLFVSVLATASKYILAIKHKHVFNPVAISVYLSSVFFDKFASWWVGVPSMLPFIVIGSFLIVRKIRRLDLVLGFLIAALLTIRPGGWLNVAKDATFLFFAGIMLVEPQTTPPTKNLRFIYGFIIGLLFYTFSPELGLLVGNIFSYIVSPKYKLSLQLKEKIKISPDTYDFIFKLDKPISFTPGQYMEFTFNHPNVDSRGNRRYFSLASSPEDHEIRLGIKFGDPTSSYKKSLLNLTSNQKIIGSQLIGDFTLPLDTSKKLVLIAGGIGITPFRSILKHLVDTNEKRDIVLLYTASDDNQFVYKDVLELAKHKLGIKTILVNTKKEGHVTAERIKQEIPDYMSRYFYISGSHNVVIAFEEIVKSLRVPKPQIITDYFPGFA